MKIIWIQFCHLVNIPKVDNYGCVTYPQTLLKELKLLIYKMSSIENYKLDKQEKQEFVQFVKNYIRNVSMNLLDRLLFHVLREVFFLFVSEMKSKWQYKHIKLFMNHLLHTAWGKHWWQNRKRMKCQPISNNWAKHVKSCRVRLSV